MPRPPTPSAEAGVASGTGRGSWLFGNVRNAGSRGVTAPSVRKRPAPEKSPSSRMFLGARLKVQEGWEGAVTSRRAGRPPASTWGRAGRRSGAGPPGLGGTTAGVFVGWFPLFPLSHMQISAPGRAGCAARASRTALEGKCGSCRGLGEPVIQLLYAYRCSRPLADSEIEHSA
ncbi:uncharacterized protein ACBT57_018781 [Dama dama]